MPTTTSTGRATCFPKGRRSREHSRNRHQIVCAGRLEGKAKSHAYARITLFVILAWETNGLEATTTEPLMNWFNTRRQNMTQGVGSYADAPLTFDWSGPANGGKPGYYNYDYHDFGPRVAWRGRQARIAVLEELLEALVGAAFGQASVVCTTGRARASWNFRPEWRVVWLAGRTDEFGGYRGPCEFATDYNMNVIPTQDTQGNPLFAPVPPALPSHSRTSLAATT